MIQNRKNGTSGAGFGITRPKNHAPEAGLNNRSGAHRARFNCNIEAALRKPVVLELPPGAPQRQNLRMRAWVVQVQGPVMGARNGPPAVNDDRADGDFLLIKAAPGLAKSLAHKFHVFRILRFGWNGVAHNLS